MRALLFLSLYLFFSSSVLVAQPLPGTLQAMPAHESLCNGPIAKSLLTTNGELWLVGNFGQCLGQARNKLARFSNGALLSALDGQSAIVSITDLVEFQGNVYLSGEFNVGSPIQLVVRARGAQLESIGYPKTDSMESVGTMEVFDGALYLGGSINAPTLRRFDGQAVTAISGLPANVNPSARVLDLQAYQGELFVAGDFSGCLLKLAGNSVVAPAVGAMVGCGWAPFSSSTQSYVATMRLFQNALYLGGRFSSIGALSVQNLARWQDGSFQALIPGADNGVSNLNNTTASVWSMLVQSGELLISGHFDRAGGVASENIIRFDGGQFLDLGVSGLRTAGASMTSVGDRVLFTGGFVGVGNQAIRYAAWWDGLQFLPWQSFDYSGAGTDGPVRLLSALENRLLVIGDFRAAGPIVAPGIATLSPSGWQAITPLPDNFTAGRATDLQGQIVVSGRASFNYQVLALIEARWQVLANSLNAISVERFQGVLYLSGTQLAAQNGPQCQNLMRWDGVSFSCVNVPPGEARQVGTVIGQELGFLGNSVSFFNGQTWRVLPPPPPPISMHQLTQFRGQPVVTGDQTTFRFNGSNWVQVTYAFALLVNPLQNCAYRGDLYSVSGDLVSLELMAYNGAVLRQTNTQPIAFAQCAVADGQLYISGNIAGNYLHRWQSEGDTVFADNFE